MSISPEGLRLSKLVLPNFGVELSRHDADLLAGSTVHLIGLTAQMLAKPQDRSWKEIAQVVNEKLGWKIVTARNGREDRGVGDHMVILDENRMAGEIVVSGEKGAGHEARLAIVVPRERDMTSQATWIEFGDEVSILRDLEETGFLPKLFCYFEVSVSGSHTPVLIREYLPGQSLTEVREERKGTVPLSYLDALGAFFGRLSRRNPGFFSHKIVPGHVVFSKTAGEISVRLRNVYLVEQRERGIDLLRHILTALLIPHKITGAPELKAFARGLKLNAGPGFVARILTDAERLNIEKQIEAFGRLDAIERGLRETYIAELKALAIVLPELANNLISLT